MEDENARRVAWAVHMRNTRVTGLAISTPPGISEAGSDLKITRERLPWE